MGDGGTRPKGWFSRRHETDEAHRASVARYQRKAKPKARIERAKRRTKAA